MEVRIESDAGSDIDEQESPGFGGQEKVQDLKSAELPKNSPRSIANKLNAKERRGQFTRSNAIELALATVN